MGNGIQAGAANFKLMADISALQQQMAQVQQLMDATGQKSRRLLCWCGWPHHGRIGTRGHPAALTAIVRGSVDAMGAPARPSIQTNETVENLSALVAAGKHTNTGAESIASAMGRMAKRTLLAPMKKASALGLAIQTLGLNLEEFRRLGPAQQMQLVAQAMNGYADSADKSAIAQALGQKKARLLPFIKDPALTCGLQAKITTEQAAQADEFGDNLVRLRSSSEARRSGTGCRHHPGAG